MARPITIRQVKNFLNQKLLPGQQVEDPIGFFTKPEGEDRASPLIALGANRSPFVQNLRLSDAGLYEVRDGTYPTNSTGDSEICGLAIYSAKDGNDYLVRMTRTKIHVYDGLAWTEITGAGFALAAGTVVQFTVWGDNLLATDATGDIYSISVVSSTYAVIAGAGVGYFITTFGSRVVSSNIVKSAWDAAAHPTRVEWTVKDDSTDWTGLGAGYDDMVSAPGGVVDIQRGIIPMTDTEALIFRASSIWVMNTTGFFDAPFALTYRFGEGTDSPYSIVKVPEGRNEPNYGTNVSQVIMLGTDDVMLVKTSAATPIGTQIRNQLFRYDLDTPNAIAGFETRRREYWLHVPPIQSDGTSIVWKYKIDDKIWYHDLYPFRMTRMAFKGLLFANSMDTLVGTMDDLTGTFNQLGGSSNYRVPGGAFAIGDIFKVVRSIAGVVNDTDGTGNDNLGIPIELQTGLILPVDALSNLTLVRVDLNYEASREVTVLFEYSVDGGNNWLSYGTLVLADTTLTGPISVPYRYTFSALNRVQLRVRGTDAGGLKLNTFFVQLVKGSMINQ